MRLGLLENAANSILHGMEHFAAGSTDPLQYKFAIQQLSHGTELLLKQRLAEAHPLLIWEDVSKPGGNSVGFDVAVKRLTAAGVNLSQYVKPLRTLRALRNRIEHFEFSLPEKEATAAIGGVLDFVFDFPANELGTNLQLAFPDPTAWQALLEIREFRARAEATAEAMQNAGTYRQLEDNCLICSSAHVVAAPDATSGDTAMCLVCGHNYGIVHCESCEQLRPEATSLHVDEQGTDWYFCGPCLEEMETDAIYEERALQGYGP